MSCFAKSFVHLLSILFLVIIVNSCVSTIKSTIVEERKNPKFFGQWYNTLILQEVDEEGRRIDEYFRIYIREKKDTIEVGEFYWYTKKRFKLF